MLILCLFVLVSKQMKKSMENDPMEFLINGGTKGSGIVFHSVDTDIDFCLEQILFFREIKSDDIGVIIMGKVFFVDV